MSPIIDAMATVSACGITLLGTFPFLHLLIALLKRPLGQLARLLSIDEESVSGLVFSLADSVPVSGNMKNMSKKGIVLNTAWLVCRRRGPGRSSRLSPPACSPITCWLCR